MHNAQLLRSCFRRWGWVIEGLSVFFLVAVLIRCSHERGGLGGAESGLAPGKTKTALVLGGVGVASFASLGVLKRLEEFGIEPDFIVTTGWPTFFALGYAARMSFNDLEWLTLVRLSPDDWNSMAGFSPPHDEAPYDLFPDALRVAFSPLPWDRLRTSVVVVHVPLDRDASDFTTSGSWNTNLARALVTPGLSKASVTRTHWDHLQPIPVQEALRLGARRILLVSMYDDCVGELARRQPALAPYAYSVQQHSREELRKSPYAVSIRVPGGCLGWASRRKAIHEGYRAAARIIRWWQQ